MMGSVLMGLIFRGIFSIGLLSATTGCVIVNYSPTVVESTLPSTRAGIVRFFFHTSAVQNLKARGNHLPVEARLIQEALEGTGGFAAAIISKLPSTKGIHVNIYETSMAPSSASNIFCMLSLLTLTLTPCYSSTGGYLVQYDLFVDDELKKSYRYEINERRVQWIALLPVMWVNGLTDDYRQAFRGTISKFIRDSQADGHLPLRDGDNAQIR